MNTAEKKIELLKLVVDADEETTDKALQVLLQGIKSKERYAESELEKFPTTRQKHLQGSSKTISLEDAHAYIRSLKQK